MGFVFVRKGRARAVRRQLDVAGARPRTTSGRTWRRRRNGASRRRRTSSSRSTRRSTSIVAEGGQPARLARYHAQLRRRWSTAWRELGLPRRSSTRRSRRRSSSRSTRPPIRATRSRSSTIACATRASSCIRASSRRSRRSASAASARSVRTRCGTRSTRCATRWREMGIRQVAPAQCRACGRA